MSSRKDLTGERFGSLTVLKKAEGLQSRYYTWLCRCDCGREVIINTRSLTSKQTTHCGCKADGQQNNQLRIKDRTGETYGALTVTRLAGKTPKGAKLWECRCECGGIITAETTQLLRNQLKDCGCGIGTKAKFKDITGSRNGKLTALYPTEKRSRKGSVIWHCRCDCGNEIEMTESAFRFGTSVSCGCVQLQRWDNFKPAELLTFVDGTCVEWLKNRKNRSDNVSGFRGISKVNETQYYVHIGLQGKKYYLGRYNSFDEAVKVRLAVEEFLHDGFVRCWDAWQEKAAADEEWSSHNPFFFTVEKKRRTFWVSSTTSERMEFHY